MAQQTSVSSLLDMTSSSNVVFLGEAGSGKSRGSFLLSDHGLERKRILGRVPEPCAG